MSDFDDAMADLNAATLDSLGYPITYIPVAGEPIKTSCMLKKPTIEQSAGPGYFGDIDIDPLQVPNPVRKDEVVWADGTVYVVGIVRNPPRGFITVAIHRKFDLP
jgi:hypothetical protein